jgi:SnoaL-like domain
MDKVDKLWAMEEIRQLKARYFRYMDTKDWAGLRTVWAEDAVFDARTALTIGVASGGPPSASDSWVYTGRYAIVDFISSAAAMPTAHHGHGHEIEVLSPVDARGVIAMEDLVWQATGDTRNTWLHGFGHYHEEYRCVDGHWLIRRSKLTRLNVTVTSGG